MKRDKRLKSKWWRITHLYKILDKQGNLVTFKPSRVQLFILARLGNRLRMRILKYRQGGVTTLFCILYLDEALWTPGFSAAIIAHERETLDKIFLIIKRAYENMPDELKPKTKQDTLRTLRFQHAFDGQKLDSEIYVALKLRGSTAQAVHVTERAYIEGEKSRELEAGSKQAVPLTGRITEETTANGFNEYYDAFMEDFDNQTDNPLDYMAIFVPWHDDPQYSLPGIIEEYTDSQLALKEQVRNAYDRELTDGQLIWYEWKQKDLEKSARESDDKVGLTGRQLMKQEYPSTLKEAFQSGLGNVFDSELLEQHVAPKPFKIIPSKKVLGEKLYIYKEPIIAGTKYTDENGEEKIYEQSKFYGIGVDPSDGGGDPAGIAVWDEDLQKVAEWHGKLRPDKIAEITAELGYMYNEALAGVENNMISAILFLSKIYDNYFITVKVDEKRQTRTKKMGWTTTGKSRDMMIDDFVMHFEEGSLSGLTSRSLKEMQTFVVKEGGKREHADGKHDDMLFADMIAVQMVKYKSRSRTRKRTYSSKPGGL